MLMYGHGSQRRFLHVMKWPMNQTLKPNPWSPSVRPLTQRRFQYLVDFYEQSCQLRVLPVHPALEIEQIIEPWAYKLE